MKTYLVAAALGIFFAVATTKAVAQPAPQHINITPYTVIPVTFDDPISIRDNEPGDTFTVTVSDDNGILPRHTKMDGHIVRIHWPNRFRPGAADMHLDDIRYPDGSIQRIDAIPVPLDAKYIRHTADGRMIADANRVPVGAYEAGGFVGGLIVGSLIHRPILGSFVGAIGGLFAGIAAHNSDNNFLVAKKGTKVGALVRSDTAPVAPVSQPYPNAAPAQTPAVVRLDNQVLGFPPDQQPFWNGQTLMVPLPYMADQLDLAVDQSADGPIHIEKDNFTLRLDQGSDTYTLNGRRGHLPAQVQNRGDITYVPVDILAAITARNVYVNGTKLPRNAY